MVTTHSLLPGLSLIPLVLSHLYLLSSHSIHYFFFFNDTATTEIYTLSLHDALPISAEVDGAADRRVHPGAAKVLAVHEDRKSTRLNSSHTVISYAVFCLKKKKIRVKNRTEN